MTRAPTAVVLGLLLIAAGSGFDTPSLIVAGVGFLLIALVCVAWVELARPRQLERKRGPATVVEGEPYPLRLTVPAVGPPLPGGELRDPLLERPVALGPGWKRSFAAEVALVGRGRRELAPAELEVRDPLGLHSRTVRGEHQGEVLVLPRIEPVLAAGQGGGGGGRRSRSVLAGIEEGAASSPLDARAIEMEVDGLRPYRVGSPASRIHWPAVARTGELVERRLDRGRRLGAAHRPRRERPRRRAGTRRRRPRGGFAVHPSGERLGVRDPAPRRPPTGRDRGRPARLARGTCAAGAGRADAWRAADLARAALGLGLLGRRPLRRAAPAGASHGLGSSLSRRPGPRGGGSGRVHRRRPRRRSDRRPRPAPDREGGVSAESERTKPSPAEEAASMSELAMPAPDRPPLRQVGIELVLFAALAAFGLFQWGRMFASPPVGALLGALAVACAGGLALALVARLDLTPRRRAAAAAIVALGSVVAALLAVGLPVRLLWSENWDELGTHLGDGLAGVEDTDLPYAGGDGWLRLTMLLGAALLVGIAAALAFWPSRSARQGARARAGGPGRDLRRCRDARRARRRARLGDRPARPRGCLAVAPRGAGLVVAPPG